MQNYKLTLEYDGTNYQGFQIQKNGNTIQAEIERALHKLFSKKVRIISCGRTDRGVHAKGHVVNFKMETKLKDGNIHKGLNRYLPKDIAIKKVNCVPLDFHAQYSVKSKIYEYSIIRQEVRSPLMKRHTFRISYLLNIPLMKRALKALEGRRDFRSFASKTDKEKGTIRTMYQAELIQKGSRYVIRLEANGFLYNMVRNIVGTVLWVGAEKISYSEFKKILQKKDRTKAGPVVPPEGLMLIRVKY